MKRRFSSADVWFYVAERVCFECDAVQFKGEKVKKCIRMSITVLTLSFRGGKLFVLRSLCAFYGDETAEPSK